MAQGLNLIKAPLLVYSNDIKLMVRAFRGRKSASYLAIILQVIALVMLSPLLLYGGAMAADSLVEAEGVLRSAAILLFSMPMMLSMLLFYPLVLTPPDLKRYLMTPIGEPGIMIGKYMTMLTYACFPASLILGPFLIGFAWFGGDPNHIWIVLGTGVGTILMGALTGCLLALSFAFGLVTKRARKVFRLGSLVLMVTMVLVLQVLFDASSRGSVVLDWLPLTWAYDLLFYEAQGYLYAAVGTAYLLFGMVTLIILTRFLWHRDTTQELDTSPIRSQRTKNIGMVLPARMGAILQKEVRTVLREPELLTRFVVISAIMIALPIIYSFSPYSPPTPLPIYLVGVAWGGSVVFTSNAFSMESGRMPLLKMTPMDPMDFVLAKSILAFIFILSAGVVTLMVQTFTSDTSGAYFVWSLCFIIIVAATCPFIGIGVGSLFPTPQKGSRYKPSFQAVFLLMLIFGVVFSPGAVLVSGEYLDHSLAAVAGIGITVLLGVAGAVVGTKMAVGRFSATS